MASTSSQNIRTEPDYYEVLEVDPAATAAEILRAYQRARETYSVDNPALYSMFSRDEAIEILKLVEEAYSVLGNPSLKRTYDSDRLTGAKSIQKNSQEKISQQITAMIGNPVSHSELPDLIAPDHFVPDPAIPQSVTTTNPILSPVAAQAASAATSSAVNSPAPTNHLQSTDTGVKVIARGDDFVVRTKERSAQGANDPNMGRTPLSVYPVNVAFEAEIKDREDFDGTFLKRVREYKQVDLGRLSEVTKIGKNHLLALEANDSSQLPAPVFLRGILVQVAKYLGLDDKKVPGSYIKLLSSGKKPV